MFWAVNTEPLPRFRTKEAVPLDSIEVSCIIPFVEALPFQVEQKGRERVPLQSVPEEIGCVETHRGFFGWSGEDLRYEQNRVAVTLVFSCSEPI